MSRDSVCHLALFLLDGFGSAFPRLADKADKTRIPESGRRLHMVLHAANLGAGNKRASRISNKRIDVVRMQDVSEGLGMHL